MDVTDISTLLLARKRPPHHRDSTEFRLHVLEDARGNRYFLTREDWSALWDTDFVPGAWGLHEAPCCVHPGCPILASEGDRCYRHVDGVTT